MGKGVSGDGVGGGVGSGVGVRVGVSLGNGVIGCALGEYVSRRPVGVGACVLFVPASTTARRRARENAVYFILDIV